LDRAATAAGYDIPLNHAVSSAVEVPVIASGGAGNLDHMADVLKQGGASAVLAASIFHFGTYTVRQAKEHLRAAGLPVRL
jgi:cyclase